MPSILEENPYYTRNSLSEVRSAYPTLGLSQIQDVLIT